MILAIDPGTEKCGLAVLDAAARVLEKRICSRLEVSEEVSGLVLKYRIHTLVVGDSTGAKNLKKTISRLDLNASLVFVPEKNSSWEARKRYFAENPPRGLLRLVPSSLLAPPAPIDDYAAVILGERYLKG